MVTWGLGVLRAREGEVDGGRETGKEIAEGTVEDEVRRRRDFGNSCGDGNNPVTS